MGHRHGGQGGRGGGYGGGRYPRGGWGGSWAPQPIFYNAWPNMVYAEPIIEQIPIMTAQGPDSVQPAPPAAPAAPAATNLKKFAVPAAIIGALYLLFVR